MIRTEVARLGDSRHQFARSVLLDRTDEIGKSDVDDRPKLVDQRIECQHQRRRPATGSAVAARSAAAFASAIRRQQNRHDHRREAG